jgi:dienelactone hydrolase
MKVVFFITVSIILSSVYCFGQKPVLTEADFSSWPHLNPSRISNDGKYVIYHISNDKTDTLYIQSLSNEYQKKIAGGSAEFLTEDSQELLYMKNDSLGMFGLSGETESYTPGVKSFKIPSQGGMPILAYQTEDNKLEVLNRGSSRRKEFDRVNDYEFSKSGKSLLIFEQSGDSAQPTTKVEWLDLVTNQSAKVWEGQPIQQYAMDQSENKIAFITGKNGNDLHCTVWEFDPHKDNAAKQVVNETTANLEAGYSVTASQLQYSPDGQRLFFRIYRLADTIKSKPGAVSVDVWNYKDEWLQCDQLNDVMSGVPPTYLSVVDLHTHRAMRLEQQQYSRSKEKFDEGQNDDYILLSTRTNNYEGYRNPLERPDIYLVDTRTGEKRCIARRVEDGQEPDGDGAADFSHTGKYITWHDPIRKTFNFYNIAKSTTYAFDLKLFGDDSFYGADAWTEDDKALLISDQYDIWQVDPQGAKAPINITHGYGRSHQINFRESYLTGVKDYPFYPQAHPIKANGMLILCAFNQQNKANGFYRIQLGSPKDPELLSMGPYAIYFIGQSVAVEIAAFLMKARDKDTFVFTKESAGKFPNLVVTHDFRTFTPLTDLAPERNVNWLTSELVRWQTYDGRPGQGILYKPTDFDPAKKYPVIFYFYQLRSSTLNFYLYPEPGRGAMNIPWYVSHGYLVFSPDIEYTLGDPGKGIYNYVVSAAEMMKTKPWVDSNRMGIQGHSFGGYEVSYLVTRTRLFAAACEGSGFTDLISFSGDRGFSACSNQSYVESGQPHMTVSLWENQAAYIRDSPVFGADEVKTPLLIMHNKQDTNVPWSQAVELFTAMHRLNKPCFLLQYDHEAHALFGADAIDFNRRLTQFFDHYLKGTPEPKWMAEGVPAMLKGIDTGLELEPTNEAKTGAKH